jgi:SOS response regulatory protein OraA/RecX
MNESARAIVLRMQAQRDHSRAELRAQLERRGFSVLEIEDAISWGENNAALDDDRASVHTIRAETRKGRGALRVQATLENRGLDPECFVPDAKEELERAVAKLKTRAQKYAGDPLAAAAWLSRQGFEEDVTRRAVEALVGVIDEGPNS